MKYNYYYCKFTTWSTSLTLGHTCKLIPSPWFLGGGGWWCGGWVEPALEFLICFSISKRFFLQWKAVDHL